MELSSRPPNTNSSEMVSDDSLIGILETTTAWLNTSGLSNDSTTVAQTGSLVIKVLHRIYMVAVPTIAIVGTICNLLAFFTFASKPLRKTSCSVYLAARSLSDTGFLISLFFTWIGDASPYRVFHRNVVCQILLFLTYFCGFLSVWLVVLITVENYIRICSPFTVARFCTVPKAVGFLIGFGVIGVLVYHFPLWTTGLMKHPNGQIYCTNLPKFVDVTRAFTYGDMVITLVIPLILIILLMIGITYSLITSLQRQKRLKQPHERNKNQRQNSKKAGSSSSPQAKVTKMLFAVSFIFLLLNLPSHAVRLKVVFLTYEEQSRQPSIDQLLQVIFQILYYLSFAVNLAVYLVCGDNFRKVFMEKYVFCFLSSKYMRRKSEVSHTSFTTLKMEAVEAPKEEETCLVN